MVALFAPNSGLRKTLTLKSQIVQLYCAGDCSVKLLPDCHGAKLTLIYFLLTFSIFKYTHRENTPLNKTKALTKSMNMPICEIGTPNQLFIRGSYTDITFKK